VGARRVAPPAVVAGKGVVGRAKVGGGDQDGGATGVAPLWIVSALDLEASPAAETAVEQGSAQCSCVHAVALAVKVSVPTSASCGERRRK
jgi:hypothetical protein